MEEVFRALSDPSRRLLLDRLFEKDGQTLGGLVKQLDMSRFGVMKHLRVLEEANLVTTIRSGREKLHYLNPVPIRLMHDRWISKFAGPWVSAITGLKRQLEEPSMPAPSHVFEIYIRTTPDKLWQALTDPELTSKYYFNTRINARDLRPGAAYTYSHADGSIAADGEIAEVDPGRRLVLTFTARWDADVASEKPSRITWQIEPAGEACRLTATFEGPDERSKMFEQAAGGMAVILSGLKTLLETGEPLQIGA